MGKIRPVVVVLIAACATAESAPSTAPVLLSVAVHDHTGSVAPNVRIRVWRRDKGAEISLMSLGEPALRSDASGQATFEIPNWPGRHMAESLTVATDPDFCQGLAPDTIVVPIRSGEAIDSAEAVFQSPREAPLARLKLGQSCGVRFPSYYMSTLRLAFDTVGTVLTGSWFLGHTQSIAPQAGRFSGFRVQDVIQLTLVPEPPACAGIFTMTARLGTDDELMDAELEAEGECFAAPAPPFYFVERDLGDWF